MYIQQFILIIFSYLPLFYGMEWWVFCKILSNFNLDLLFLGIVILVSGL